MGRLVPDSIEVEVTHKVDIDPRVTQNVSDNAITVIGFLFLCATAYKLITRTSDKETYVVLP